MKVNVMAADYVRKPVMKVLSVLLAEKRNFSGMITVTVLEIVCPSVLQEPLPLWNGRLRHMMKKR